MTAATVLTLTSAVIQMGCCEAKTMVFAVTASAERNKRMKEYIELKAAVELAMQYCLDDDGTCSKADRDIRELLDELEAIPAADVVPVVRCRECKHCIASRQGKLFCIHGFEQTIISAFAAIDNPIFERELDSFCSYGERKEA